MRNLETLSVSPELVHSVSFKEMIGKHRGIIGSFHSLMNKINEAKETKRLMYGDIFEEGDLKLKVIGSAGEGVSEGEPVGKAIYFKAQVDKESFFIKDVPGLSDGTGRGAEEFKSLENAAKLLKGIEGVEVIDFQLGYQDTDRTYFVSKWRDGVILGEYLTALYAKVDAESLEKRNNLLKRYKVIDDIMEAHNFQDFHFDNVLYDQSTDMLIVFDVHN